MDEKNQRHESLYSNGPKWNHFCELVEKKRSTVNEPVSQCWATSMDQWMNDSTQAFSFEKACGTN